MRSIREQDPLKQGLKLFQKICIRIYLIIREQDPLKQGLKPVLVAVSMTDILLFVSKIH